jgi:non-specific riboncleoside hydrolase
MPDLTSGIFLGETMRLPIILDTDPGIDDAAAIAAALFALSWICS